MKKHVNRIRIWSSMFILLAVIFTIYFQLPVISFSQSAKESNKVQARENWERQREKIRNNWLDQLGYPVNYEFEPKVTSVEKFQTPEFDAEFLFQRNSPKTRQRLLLLKPKNLKGKAPGAVVPFYDCDSMCGYDISTHQPLPSERLQARFGRHLVKLGFVVLCVETYPFNNVNDPLTLKKKGLVVWAEAIRRLNIWQPNWTGIGKLTADAKLAVDYLVSLDCVDKERIAMAGHSLGGKVSFYAGCLDDRVKAVLVSDFGMRWQDSNWNDAWYWGEKRVSELLENGMDHSSLLALQAPGLFLFIAGQADGEQSRDLLNKAEEYYKKIDAKDRIYFYNHASGHQPTWSTVNAAFNRLGKEFGLPYVESFEPAKEAKEMKR